MYTNFETILNSTFTPGPGAGDDRKRKIVPETNFRGIKNEKSAIWEQIWNTDAYLLVYFEFSESTNFTVNLVAE